MDNHTEAVSKSWFYHIGSFRPIRSSLDDSTALSVTTALVSSRLDYANSILFGYPLTYRSRLQWVQNALARITVPRKSSCPIRSLLRHLHWLLITPTSVSNSTITFKALGTGRPPYLASLLHNYSRPWTMCSSSAKLLTVPHHNLSLGSGAFRISAPTTWNSLPQNVRDCVSLASFRNQTHYFSIAFSVLWHLIHIRLDSNLTIPFYKSFTYLLSALGVSQRIIVHEPTISFATQLGGEGRLWPWCAVHGKVYNAECGIFVTSKMRNEGAEWIRILHVTNIPHSRRRAPPIV